MQWSNACVLVRPHSLGIFVLIWILSRSYVSWFNSIFNVVELNNPLFGELFYIIVMIALATIVCILSVVVVCSRVIVTGDVQCIRSDI